MKMELIACLLHRPKVLFLDEPTIGLDVDSQKKVREFLRDYNARYRVVTMLTSHYMQDIEELCRRVIVIDQGRIFFDGPLEQITDRFSSEKILSLEFTGRAPGRDFAGLGAVVEQSDLAVKLRVPRAEIAAVCRRVLDAHEVRDISVQEVPIEEIISQLFARNKEAVAEAALEKGAA